VQQLAPGHDHLGVHDDPRGRHGGNNGGHLDIHHGVDAHYDHVHHHVHHAAGLGRSGQARSG